MCGLEPVPTPVWAASEAVVASPEKSGLAFALARRKGGGVPLGELERVAPAEGVENVVLAEDHLVALSIDVVLDPGVPTVGRNSQFVDLGVVVEDVGARCSAFRLALLGVLPRRRPVLREHEVEVDGNWAPVGEGGPVFVHPDSDVVRFRVRSGSEEAASGKRQAEKNEAAEEGDGDGRGVHDERRLVGNGPTGTPFLGPERERGPCAAPPPGRVIFCTHLFRTSDSRNALLSD